MKSNLGHTEGASGTCALTKVCLAFENRELPPNLHLNEYNPNIEGLKTGILEPVVTRQAFHENIVGISSFGFGGCNVYSILKANEKECTPSSFDICSRIPRIVTASGRTDESVNHIFSYVSENRPRVTNEFLSLLTDTMATNPANGMKHRGYTILDEKGTVAKKVVG